MITVTFNRYGLLGASGCGKTTLLSCIVGRNYLNSGELWVLGGKPGTIGSGVPGPSVGYMPQNVALCTEFTVSDSIYYFGRLAGLGDDLIKSRYVEIKTLLDLPPDERYIKNCSGGQQRRISLASALIHKPQLLILDEPTAGVDPVLRDRIWTFLGNITQKDKITVIITTHYIEEARAADFIGLMRSGKLLAEAPPNTLLRVFQTETLEEVFLMLSRKQEGAGGIPGSISLDEMKGTYMNMQSLETTTDCSFDMRQDLFYQMRTPRPSIVDKGYIQRSALELNRHRIWALMDKNWKQFYRNVSGWLFILFLLPIVCSALFLVVVGHDIKNLKLAVVNQDSQCKNVSLKHTVVPDEDGNCHMENMSCRFLNYLKNDPRFNCVPMKSLDEAVEGVRKGKFLGVFFWPQNHSYATEQRLLLAQRATDEVLDLSEMKVYMDMSDYVTSLTTQRNLIQLYLSYLNGIFDDCKYQNFINRTVRFEEMYGKATDSLTENMVPGYLLTVISYLATMLTSQIIIAERLGGVWDRSAVAGVTPVEIILTHFLLQFCVVLVQSAELYIISFVFFEVPMTGSVYIAILMAVLQGIAGMCYGFLVSITSYDDYFIANILITGGFYPMVLICGTFWPLAAQPKILQWIASATPFALPAESFRLVLKKGFDLTNLLVLRGVAIELAWILVLILASIYMLKVKQ
ncbi:hypothetical protein WA026_007124 [Henosepilachna vigintioctopunctata]|uniref:ABC transporter domain-containing protein n=1 Tax=Henosepilachna vigintioctopunctata TaxID=420089 RepID=A0AAW1VBT4_9CUCU